MVSGSNHALRQFAGVQRIKLSQGLRPLPPAPFGFSGLPFGGLGVFFFKFWEPFLAPREDFGGHFGISGASWDAIWRPQAHPGGPWEQQDGLEVVNNTIFVDFG